MLLVLIVAGAAMIFAVTRGPIARKLVRDRLGSLTTGQIDIAGASLGLDGSVHISGVRIGVPGLRGRAGEVIYAESVDITLAGLLSGSSMPESIVVDRARIRVSQDMRTGGLNLNSLRVRSQAAGKTSLPDITVENTIIELGEHDDANYNILRTLPVRGVLTPGQTPGTYVFEVTHPDTPDNPTRLTGTITDDELDIVVSAMDLAAWPNEAVPSAYRQLHRSLNLKGQILPTRIRVPRTGPVELSVRLDGVELNLPIAQTPIAGGRMKEVQGSLDIGAAGVRADLAGLLDDVPAHATLVAPSLDPDGPFKADLRIGRIRLRENLDRLSYVPEYVREQLELFSNPTAEIELDLVLQRPEGSRHVFAEGQLQLYNGVASFRDFPYEFHKMSGLFRLKRNRLEFEAIRGIAESGAKLEASGWVEPLGPDAEAVVDVYVTDVPLDERLRAGFATHSRDLYDALLDRKTFAQLIEQGMIVSSQQHQLWQRELDEHNAAIKREPDNPPPELAARISELESLLTRKTFDLGGVGSVEIHVHRHPGVENIWDTEVIAALPEVGLVPKHFPLPIEAEGFKLRVFNGRAELVEGTFRGHDGGSATIRAIAHLDEQDQLPQMHIEACDVPVTPLLVQAISGPRKVEQQGALSVHDLLEHLGLEGTVDCIADVGPDDGPDFEIIVTPNALRARPDSWTSPTGRTAQGLQLDAITGRILVRPGELDLNLAADIPGSSGSSARAKTTAHAGFGDSVASGFQLHRSNVSLTNFDAATPIEQLVAVINPSSARQLAELRRAYEPRGSFDAQLTYILADAPRIALEIASVRTASVNLFDGRLGIDQSRGTIHIERAGALDVRFERFGGVATFDGQPLGDILVDGRLGTPEQDRQAVTEITLTNGRFESPIATKLLEDRAPTLARTIARAQPHGLFDLHAKMLMDPSGRAELIHAELSPKSLSFTTREQRLDFAAGSGRVTFDGVSGIIEQLTLGGSGIDLAASGTFALGPGDNVDVQVGLEVFADSLDQRVRALLPQALDDVLASMSIATEGPVALREGNLLFASTPQSSQIDVLGRVTMKKAKASIGVGLSDVDAELTFAAHAHPSMTMPEFEINLAATSARAWGIWLSDVQCPIRSSGAGPDIHIGPFSAFAHDGRIAGSAIIWTEPDDERPRYDLRVLTSGVRFAPVLADLALDTSPPDPASIADETRGVLDAQLTLYGIINGPRRGIGTAQVSQGRVLRLPLVVPLVEVSNLRLPTGEQLDLATSQFYIHNDLLTFEAISVLSRSIKLVGYGTMSLPDLALDLRINSRSTRPIPVLSKILEGVRDEVLTTRIAGTLHNPDISAVPFSTTRQVVASLFGEEPTEQDKLLREIKQRALQYSRRTRIHSDQIHSVVESHDPQGNNHHP
ncbi:MAG: hypothetical protein D6695_12155 [Planctomycetota bacterium]|nr:MAG: hypothetical protein D6695_12155 [Planctomycetota bacterium]